MPALTAGRLTWQVTATFAKAPYQFDDEDDARDFAAQLTSKGSPVSGVEHAASVTETVLADRLRDDDRLADGTRILRLFFGKDKVRVTGWQSATFRSVRRAYRYDQQVAIEARP